MNSNGKNRLYLFREFMDGYSVQVCSTIARLTGIKDQRELEQLSVITLTELWANNEILFGEERPAAFVYKVVLKQVFIWLRRRNNTARIELLQAVLPIDRVHYKHLIE